MKVTVRLSVLKDKSYVKTPHFSTPRGHEDPNGYYCTTGIGPGKTVLSLEIDGYGWLTFCLSVDIREATRDAVRHMITMLGIEHGLTREEAYMLCSVTGDLRMHEVVRITLYPKIFVELTIWTRWTCQTTS